MSLTSRMDRRKFLALTAAATLAPAAVVARRRKTLHILQWSHFVPAYDTWFDQFAADWGRRNDVEVTVDHIALADLSTKANAEVAAQRGHDLFQFLTPPAAFESQVLDVADVVKEAERRHGPMLDLCRRNTYNPTTKRWFGFCDNFVADPGNYLKSVWTDAGLPDGPATWADLERASPAIRAKHAELQIPIGIGMSQELDSNQAARALLWSFDAAVQDAEQNVVLRSEHSLEALEFATRLFKTGMSPAVLSWNAASNNQALIAGQTSYILNSISAYRTAQDNKLPVADDICFVPPLKGPRGTRWASEHVTGIYAIWKFAEAPDLAKRFLIDLVDRGRDAVLASKLYNSPSLPGSVAEPKVPAAKRPEAGQRWLKEVTAKDPFGSTPPSKLAALGDALQWSANIGYPGPANAAIGEVFDTYVLPTMFARAATGLASPKQALEDAHQRVKSIFEKWRTKGLVAGGDADH